MKTIRLIVTLKSKIIEKVYAMTDRQTADETMKIPLRQNCRGVKRKVSDQCFFPTVTYGAETWNPTKRQKRLSLKLRPMQRAHERIMLNLTWKGGKTAKWLRQKTKVRYIHETISELRWNWAGHIARITDSR